MVIIGVDPHKRTHTASGLEPGSHRVLASIEITAALGDYRRLLRWASQFGERRWAVENARGLGGHLAQWLLVRGEPVHDVTATATARVRELSRGGRRKNDVIDAAAAASVALLAGDSRSVAAVDLTTVLALLDERRGNLVAQRTRSVNQLGRSSLPCCATWSPAAPAPTSPRRPAAKALTAVRPVGPVETARKALARDIIAEVRDLDVRLKNITVEMSRVLGEHGTTLRELDGVGPVVAARLLGRTGHAGRFTSTSAFASYAGVAPVEVASAQKARHRLPRGGDRQLNLALHTVALTQVRMRFLR